MKLQVRTRHNAFCGSDSDLYYYCYVVDLPLRLPSRSTRQCPSQTTQRLFMLYCYACFIWSDLIASMHSVRLVPINLATLYVPSKRRINLWPTDISCLCSRRKRTGGCLLIWLSQSRSCALIRRHGRNMKGWNRICTVRSIYSCAERGEENEILRTADCDKKKKRKKIPIHLSISKDQFVE